MKLKNPSSENIFQNAETIQSIIQKWKDQGDTIVFTNGCFDILHAGHVDYLEKAGCFANRMIVGLNSDDSVKRLKGGNRPINGSFERARLLASLKVVDAVVFFSEDTPLNLIQAITPNVLIKGSDYDIQNIVGSEHVLGHGGKVETIDFVHNTSTSQIIDKIKSL